MGYTNHSISVGNIFEQAGAWKSRWLVKNVIERPGCPTHARLVSTDNRHESKLIAVHALQDRAKFTFVAQAEPAAAE